MTDNPASSSLDPRVNPWKRGDVCTRHFDSVGFVVNCTAEYIEFRWLEAGAMTAIERLRPDEMNYLRVGHAEGPALDGHDRTNLEALQSLEALDAIRDHLANRTFSAREEQKANALIKRALAPDACNWDKEHRAKLLALATAPEQMSFFFKLRERFHQLICPRSR